MAGPEIQANAIWTALHGVPLRERSAARWTAARSSLLGLVAPLARLRLRRWPRAAGHGAGGGRRLRRGRPARLRRRRDRSPWSPPLLRPGAGRPSARSAASHLAESRERRARRARQRAARAARCASAPRSCARPSSRSSTASARRPSRATTTPATTSSASAACASAWGCAAGMSADEAEMLAPRQRHARRRQDRHPRPRPAQARPARRGGVGDDEDPHHDRRGDPRRLALAAASSWPRRSRSPITSAGTAAATRAGLAGEEIPLAGRICAICDVFDALLSERPYKEPWPLDDALAEIARQRGRHFDPRLAELFLELAPELFAEIDYAPRARRPEPRLAEHAAR